MGNRVCIKLIDSNYRGLKTTKSASCSLYLHWNGGRESTEAFFNATYDFMAENGRNGDLNYFSARFVQTIGHYLGGVYSLGLIANTEVKDWTSGCDNPTVTFDIQTRQSGAFTGQCKEKYDDIYKLCTDYLYSTLSAYEIKSDKHIESIDAEIKRLTELKAEALKKLEQYNKERLNPTPVNSWE